MKLSRNLLLMLALTALFSSTHIFAFGSKEKIVGEEGPRIVDVYYLVSGPGAGTRTLAAEAAMYLFQSYSAGKGAVDIGSSRKFSMPAAENEIAGEAGGFTVIKSSVELSPASSLYFRDSQMVTIEFSVDELYSGSRIRLQPAQKALLGALSSKEIKKGIARIVSLDYSRSGMFKAVVETAQTVD